MRTFHSLFFALLVFGNPAAGSVIATNFLPGDTYGPGGQTVGSYSFCPDQSPFCRVELAMPFTPLQDYTLDTIRVAASHAYGSDASKGNQLTVYLAAGATAPGAPVESFSFVNLPDFSEPNVSAGISVLHPLLSAGVRYWVVVTTDDLDANAMVWYAGGNAPEILVRATGYTAWTTFTPAELQPTAFDVQGTPVALPEPGTISLTAVGLLAAYTAHRRRRG